MAYSRNVGNRVAFKQANTDAKDIAMTPSRPPAPWTIWRIWIVVAALGFLFDGLMQAPTSLSGLLINAFICCVFLAVAVPSRLWRRRVSTQDEVSLSK